MNVETHNQPIPVTPAHSADMAARAEEAAGLLRTLSHPARLMLACKLAEGEFCVADLEASLGIHQPSLSQQLGVLRDAGIVETRRDAKRIYYKLTEARAASLIGALYTIYCEAETDA